MLSNGNCVSKAVSVGRVKNPFWRKSLMKRNTLSNDSLELGWYVFGWTLSLVYHAQCPRHLLLISQRLQSGIPFSLTVCTKVHPKLAETKESQFAARWEHDVLGFEIFGNLLDMMNVFWKFLIVALIPLFDLF